VDRDLARGIADSAVRQPRIQLRVQIDHRFEPDCTGAAMAFTRVVSLPVGGFALRVREAAT
jgi:hypothetical protein